MSPLSSAVARFAQHHLTRDNSNQPYSIRAEQQPALMAAVGKFIAKLTPRAASPSVAAPAAAAPSSSAAPVLCSSSRDTAMVRGLVSMIVTWPSLIRQQCTRPPNGPSVSCKQERQVQCEVYEFIRAAGLSCGIGIASPPPTVIPLLMACLCPRLRTPRSFASWSASMPSLMWGTSCPIGWRHGLVSPQVSALCRNCAFCEFCRFCHFCHFCAQVSTEASKLALRTPPCLSSPRSSSEHSQAKLCILCILSFLLVL
jgi:hypothetical protein